MGAATGLGGETTDVSGVFGESAGAGLSPLVGGVWPATTVAERRRGGPSDEVSDAGSAVVG